MDTLVLDGVWYAFWLNDGASQELAAGPAIKRDTVCGMTSAPVPSSLFKQSKPDKQPLGASSNLARCWHYSSHPKEVGMMRTL